MQPSLGFSFNSLQTRTRGKQLQEPRSLPQSDGRVRWLLSEWKDQKYYSATTPVRSKASAADARHADAPAEVWARLPCCGLTTDAESYSSQESTSTYNVQWGCVRRIVVGQAVEIGSCKARRTTSRFARPGTMQYNRFPAISAGIVKVSACVGTTSKVGKHPSLTCC